MSVLNVNEIHDTTGNQALTINSSGIVTKPQLPYVAVDMGGGNVYEAVANQTAFPFDNVYAGDASLWNTSTYLFTCPVAGVYQMFFSGIINPASNVQIHFVKNNTAIYYTYVNSERGLQGFVFVPCEANDTLGFVHSSGSSRSFYNGTTTNRYTTGTIALIG